MNNKENIRNFAIIAHIDHGKSTLADNIIATCNNNFEIDLHNPFLDNMSIEKERGITIKTQTVRLKYNYKGEEIILNLLDTPGHVDFSYEAKRALYACQGSLLVVDASQGVEAQTLSNLYAAMESNHVIIPVINKIDLPSANIPMVEESIYALLGKTVPCVRVSAKMRIGIEDLLEAIIKYIPAPEEKGNYPTGLIIDSWYDSYVGEQLLVSVQKGPFKTKDFIATVNNDVHTKTEIKKFHFFTPEVKEIEELNTGDIGVITTFSKKVFQLIGDTIVLSEYKDQTDAIVGFKPLKSMVYCSFFPPEDLPFENAKRHIEVLHLNDPSFTFEIEKIEGLGPSFRCGFLGLLHMDITKERLLREAKMDVSVTTPSVEYKITDENGKTHLSHSPLHFPENTKMFLVEEPWVSCKVFTKHNYVGDVINLCLSKRGEQVDILYQEMNTILHFNMPLNEIIVDFQDKLQTITNGFGSFDYEEIGYRPSDLVKVKILINSQEIPLLSFVTHVTNSENRGRKICETLKEILPRQQFVQALQASIGGKIIARENISAYRKDVTSGCYGGDQTRKDKLLNRQKEGKKKLKSLGNRVEIDSKDIIKIFKIS